jgi:hypothetical protein
MSEPNKHHYLPVFYLSQWARADGKVIRYHRPVGDVVAHPIAPRSTGFEPGLYGLDGYAEGQRNAIETAFMSAVVDSPAALALRVLISRDQARMTPAVRIAWARFVMSLMVRHPTAIDQITRQGAEQLRPLLLQDPAEYEARRQPGDPDTLLQWVEKYSPEVLLNFGKQNLPGIVSHAPTRDAILKMRWATVGLADATTDLLVSDRPAYRSHGVLDENCVIAVPLSPRFLFIATRSQATLDQLMAQGADALANNLNALLVEQAEAHVYAAHEKHLPLVRQRLRKKREAEVQAAGV